jgi:hypothetical protein
MPIPWACLHTVAHVLKLLLIYSYRCHVRTTLLIYSHCCIITTENTHTRLPRKEQLGRISLSTPMAGTFETAAKAPQQPPYWPRPHLPTNAPTPASARLPGAPPLPPCGGAPSRQPLRSRRRPPLPRRPVPDGIARSGKGPSLAARGGEPPRGRCQLRPRARAAAGVPPGPGPQAPPRRGFRSRSPLQRPPARSCGPLCRLRPSEAPVDGLRVRKLTAHPKCVQPRGLRKWLLVLPWG